MLDLPNRGTVLRDALHRLGREPDRALARELDVPHHVVRRARQRLAIPPFSRAPTPDVLLEVAPGTTDAAVARITGVARSTVGWLRRRAGRPSAHSAAFARVATDPRLGIDTDLAVAARCGCSRAAVQRVRSKLGITRRPAPRSRPGASASACRGR